MGGTFNPVHVGHLMIAEKAREQFQLDEVLFIPSGVPYLKNLDEVLPGKVRLEMTRLAIEENPFFTISSIETEKESNTYTYETLEILHDKNPNTQYYFVLGADSLYAIENWKHPERIFADCQILAAVRDDKETTDLEAQASRLKEKYNAEIYLLQTGRIDLSSSMIRRLVKEGKSIRYLVPDPVYDYIIKNKLYKEV